MPVGMVRFIFQLLLAFSSVNEIYTCSPSCGNGSKASFLSCFEMIISQSFLGQNLLLSQ